MANSIRSGDESVARVSYPGPDAIVARLKALQSDDPEFQADVNDLRRIVHRTSTMRAKFDHVTESDALGILKELGVGVNFEPDSDKEVGTGTRRKAGDVLDH